VVILKRNLVVLGIVIVVVAGMLYLGAYNSHPGSGSASAAVVKGKLTGDPVGKMAPDFELKTLEGKPLRLSDYRGKAVLLNFWATWCGPCKIEMPWFVDLQKKYGPQGLQIVGVAMEDTDVADIKKFTQEMGVNYPVARGREAVGEAYGGVMGLPTSFYIGRDGSIVEQSAGLIGKDEIEKHIQAALAKGAAEPHAGTPAGK
jgi:thiol-disulfide isomerase/thioredoxin